PSGASPGPSTSGASVVAVESCGGAGSRSMSTEGAEISTFGTSTRETGDSSSCPSAEGGTISTASASATGSADISGVEAFDESAGAGEVEALGESAGVTEVETFGASTARSWAGESPMDFKGAADPS